MLVQKQSNIMILKLSSGEEIIAQLVENGPNPTVVNPLMMVLVPGEDGSSQSMVAFTPWVLGAQDDQPMRISAANIIVQTPARQDAIDQYLQLIPRLGDSRNGADNLTHTQTGGKGK